MTSLEAILLGLTQGLSEFLPVSSSGHLVIAQALLGLRSEGLLFEIAVHVATLVSVLVFYRRRVAELLVGMIAREASAWRYGAKLMVASLPALIAVLLIGDFLEAQFERPAVTGVCLLLTGVALWTTRSTAPVASREEPGWLAAFGIGCAQAVAILPGVSRSGATVAVALALGVRPIAAAEFSFLMSVIAISGAAARQLFALGPVAGVELAALWWGGLVAMVSGLAAIWLFVRLLRGLLFYRFAYYTWAVGSAFLIWLALA
jgi:undecaprenyl-diphosphatase